MSPLDDQHGLNKGPALLGRSYHAVARRVEAAWQLAMDQNIPDPVLGLIARTMNVATSPDEAALLTRLDYLIERAIEWRDELNSTECQEDDVIDNPFEEKSFADRLVELMANNEHSARLTDEEATYEELRGDLADLLGNRDDLAEKITVTAGEAYPVPGGDEVSRVVYATLAYLFGEDPTARSNGCHYCTSSTNPDMHDHVLNVHPLRYAEWAEGRKS